MTIKMFSPDETPDDQSQSTPSNPQPTVSRNSTYSSKQQDVRRKLRGLKKSDKSSRNPYPVQEAMVPPPESQPAPSSDPPTSSVESQPLATSTKPTSLKEKSGSGTKTTLGEVRKKRKLNNLKQSKPKSPTEDSSPIATEMYYLVSANNGAVARCEAYSTYDAALDGLAEATSEGMPLDVRVFLFKGSQIHIPMIDEGRPDIVVVGLDGKRRRLTSRDVDPDKSNLQTGIVFKQVDDTLDTLDVPETTGFTFD